MNERTVIDFLALQNKWWFDRNDFPFDCVYDFKRSDYYYLSDSELNAKEATVIVGPRGVGKSTVLLEIIRKLLGFSEKIPRNTEDITISSKAVNQRRVLYASFEDPKLQKIGLLELLGIYAKYVLKEDISQLKEKIYVFFDEIQDIQWGNQIKAIQNLNYPIKIFISGSSSISMTNEVSNAVRRVNFYSMHPLKFSDFLRYKINDKTFEDILKSSKELREEIVELHRKNDAQSIFKKYLQLYSDLKPWQIKIEILFDEYLLKGGYPAFLDETDYFKCSSKLSDIFWLGFHKDLLSGKGIGDPQGLKNLAEYISSISSCETNYASLTKNGGTASNTDTLKNYLYHLERSFFIVISERISGGTSKKGHAFKIYFNDIAVRNMLQGLMNDLLLKNSTQYGYVIETLVFDHLVRLHHKLRPGMPLYYWKSRERKAGETGNEVDIILKLNGHKIPVEVKKADSPSLSDLKGLRMFCEDTIPGIVSCGKRLDLEDNILFLPHWLFILIC